MKRETLAVILVMVGILVGSWILTCGLIKLITLCFSFSFGWGWATGIWLILLYIKFNRKGSNNDGNDK